MDRLLKGRGTLAGLCFVNAPGGFTSLRTGLVLAQTLAFARTIPLIELTSSDPKSISAAIRRAKKVAQLQYGRAPSITLPRSNPTRKPSA